MKQVEEANKQQEQQMQQMNAKTNGTNRIPMPVGTNAAMFGGASLDDIIDELT